MPKELYDRPKAPRGGISRTVEQVARPWLETGKRVLSAEDAEFIVTLCEAPHILASAGAALPPYSYPARLASLLSTQAKD